MGNALISELGDMKAVNHQESIGLQGYVEGARR